MEGDGNAERTEARVIKWAEEGSETFEWRQKFRKFEKQTQNERFPGRNCDLTSANA